MLTDKLSNAKKYAIAAHGNQKYGDEFPYAIHLQATESVLLRFDITAENLRCAAWLHDVLEDTDRRYEEVELYFGQEVATIVAALTEPKGGNRAYRHSETYPRIARNYCAIIIKLADRIANVECGGDKAMMYVKEYPTFKSTLNEHAEVWSEKEVQVLIRMWQHLDGLMLDLAMTKSKRKKTMKGV